MDYPALIAGAQGVGEIADAATYEGMLKGAGWRLNSFELSNVTVRRLTADVAFIAYRVIESMTLNGQPLELEANDTSVWVKRGEEWLCAAHTEALEKAAKKNK